MGEAHDKSRKPEFISNARHYRVAWPKVICLFESIVPWAHLKVARYEVPGNGEQTPRPVATIENVTGL
jgi:hypothetical protein